MSLLGSVQSLVDKANNPLPEGQVDDILPRMLRIARSVEKRMPILASRSLCALPKTPAPK